MPALPTVGIDKLDQAAIDAVRALWDSAFAAGELTDHAYLSPSDESLSWQDWVGKLVKVNDVAEIVHIMVARVAVRGVAATQRRILERVIQTLETTALKWGVASLVVRRLVTASRTLASQLVGLLFDMSHQEQIERRIREAAQAARADIREHYLRTNDQKHERHTRIVYTRHKTPRQRGANKSWQNPPAN